MKCSKCGIEVPRGKPSCPACGTPRPATSSRLKRFDDPSQPPADPDETEMGPSSEDGDKAAVFSDTGDAEAPATSREGEPPPAHDTHARSHYEEAQPTLTMVPDHDAGPTPAPLVEERAGAPSSLGPYTVTGLLGRGGMGAVYSGMDKSLDRRVAIKVLAPEHARDQEFVERFLEEAKAVAMLLHPNVVAIYFAGTDEGRHFFAMEYVDGESLHETVQRDGPIVAKEAMGYIHEAALGLQAALEAGMIHRDVKPANLMRDLHGAIKVADFGLAKLTTHLGSGVGEVVGSPNYMSPEQGRGEAVDHRADIYSLGATLFYLLTGHPPFEAPDVIAVIYKHCNDPIPKIPNAPFGLDKLLGKMMAKDAKHRFPDYPALIKELDRLHKSGMPGKPLVSRDWELPDPEHPYGQQHAADDSGVDAIRAFSEIEEKAEHGEMDKLLSDLDDIMGEES